MLIAIEDIVGLEKWWKEWKETIDTDYELIDS